MLFLKKEATVAMLWSSDSTSTMSEGVSSCSVGVPIGLKIGRSIQGSLKVVGTGRIAYRDI